MIFHFFNFSQCVVCMFGHKTIYKLTNLKVHSKERYFVVFFIPVPVAQWLEHCASSAKVVGSIPREHMYSQKNV